jgi:hypothetical protein
MDVALDDFAEVVPMIPCPGVVLVVVDVVTDVLGWRVGTTAP